MPDRSSPPRARDGAHTAVTASLARRLRDHATLAGIPDGELAWVAERGACRAVAEGDLLDRAGEPVDRLYLVLAGRLEVVVPGPAPRRVAGWGPGEVTGLLPFSRSGPAPGHLRAAEPGEVLVLDRDAVTALPAACPGVTERLVHAMVDRVRTFSAEDLRARNQRELGQVAAGLARELCSPSEGLARAARILAAALDAEDAVAWVREVQGLGEAELEGVAWMVRACAQPPRPRWTEAELEARERALEAWLSARGGDDLPAGALAATGAPLDGLLAAAGSLPGEVGPALLSRIGRSLVARRLTAELEAGAHRIRHLVDAVDRLGSGAGPVTIQNVAVNPALRAAVALAAPAAREAEVVVRLDLATALPPVRGVAEALDRTWHGLLLNAIHAAAPAGTVEVSSREEEGGVRVEILDNGPGVPEEIRDRIFDAFFTTKPPGVGAGLGLDQARRIIDQHGGTLSFESRPGRTVFRVILPGRR